MMQDHFPFRLIIENVAKAFMSLIICPEKQEDKNLFAR